MTITDVAVGGKVTAAKTNEVIDGVNEIGMTVVVPTITATAGVSIDATGLITCTAAAQAPINGAFVAGVSYRVDVALQTSVGILQFRLRASGTDAATDYDRTRVLGVGATVTSAQSLNQTLLVFGGAAIAGRTKATIELSDVAAASPSYGFCVAGTTDNPMTASAANSSTTWQHRTATAYDGITIFPSAGTMTGTIRIYRYA